MDGPAVSQMTNKKDTKMESSGQNRTKDVRIENFDISYGDRYNHFASNISLMRNNSRNNQIWRPCLYLYFRALLKSADLNLAFGRRYGLVGRNGIGKTTLLRMMSRYVMIQSLTDQFQWHCFTLHVVLHERRAKAESEHNYAGACATFKETRFHHAHDTCNAVLAVVI